MRSRPEVNGVPHNRPIEVLNFEDDPADAILVEKTLRKVFLVQFRVTTVSLLEEGLERLREKNFDVALVDLSLPDASGITTFELLHSKAPELPLIVLTGNQDDQLAVQILRRGAQDYLLKDEISGAVLSKAIIYAIERNRVRVEKDVLLKEIHHRVKNNLQIISSLLNLQSRRIKDPHTLEMFRESCDRIQLMALIHEKLYRAADLSQLDFTDYLRTLSVMILRSYASKSRHVQIAFNVDDPLNLTLDLAIPLGLIASELISNSLKHAFSRGGHGTITIQLTQMPSNLVFSVSDDGQGLPSSFSMEEPASLGLRLVKMLSQQIGAQLEWSRTPSTRFTLKFQQPGETKTRRVEHETAGAQSA